MLPGLVSVIMPAYNQAAYVGQAIESVLSQTYANAEVIVVDDGSTDGTDQVVAQYGHRVQQVAQPNAGLSAARNTGIRHARGEYIAFLDADDLWLPRLLETEVAVLRRAPAAGLVYGGYLLVDQSLRRVGAAGPGALWTSRYAGLDAGLRRLRRSAKPPQTFADSLGVVLPHNRIGVITVVVRSSWLERVGPFETSLRACEDWDLWIRLALAGCGFAAVPEPVALHRLHDSNMSADPERMVAATFKTLDRACQHPAVGAGHESLKRASYREQHLQASIRYEAVGDEEKACDHLCQALALAWDGAASLDLVEGYARSRVWGAIVTDALAERRLRRLSEAIARLAGDEDRLTRPALAKLAASTYLVAALVAFRSNPVRSARLLRQAIQVDPGTVLDPGNGRAAMRWFAFCLHRVVS